AVDSTALEPDEPNSNKNADEKRNPGEVTELRNEAAAKTSKALSSRKRPLEKMISPGRRAVNKNERKSPNFGFEKLRASESVKVERISSRFYEESSTGISEIESPRKRSFKEVRDPGSKTINSKKRKDCDRAIETSTVSVPSKAKIISTQLQNEFGKCASKMELSRKRHFEERKGNLEETSDKSPSQTVNSEQGKISSLAFEDSSSSVHVKSKCISTILDDKSDIYISGIESLRKRPLEGMSNPGTEGENPPKKHCDRSFKISNALLPEKPESKSTLLIDDLGTFTSKIKASRKMHFEEKKNSIEERSDQGLSKVVNPEQIKTHDLISENSDSSVPVKAEFTSVQLHGKLGTWSPKIEPSKRRYYERTNDQGLSKTVNPKPRQIDDLGFDNLSTSLPLKHHCISSKLQEQSDSYNFKIGPSRKMYLEEVSDKGSSEAEDPEQIKTHDLISENSDSSVPVKTKCISVRSHDESGSESEASRKRNFEEISDPGPEAVNKKKRKTWDVSFENLSTSMPVKAELVSRLLQDTWDYTLDNYYETDCVSNGKLNIKKSKEADELILEPYLNLAKHILLSKSGTEEDLWWAENWLKLFGKSETTKDLKRALNLKQIAIAKIKHLFQNDIKLDSVNASNKALLDNAIKTKNLILIKYLSKNGAKLDTEDGNNETPLIRAIKAKELDLVQCLLESGANPNRGLCLHHAVLTGSSEVCSLLLYAGADYNHMNEFQETALDLAVKTKNLTLVKLLMPLGGIDEVELHQRLHYIAGMESNYISELLAIAVEVDCRIFIKVLVSNGANFGQCLHIAVENGNKYTCEELIKNGADINARNEKNETPLDLALKTGKFDIVKSFWKLRRTQILVQLLHSVFLPIGGNNDYSEDLLVCAVEANNSLAFNLLLSNRASPKKLANKVKGILDQRQNTYVVNHSNSPPVFLSNFENLLKKLIEFSYFKYHPIKSKEILVLSLSICSMCLPDDPLVQFKTLKDECRKIIRETTNFSRMASNQTPKVEAISEMPQPANKDELTIFLGKANSLLKYIPLLSCLNFPLRELGKQNVFEWTNQPTAAVDKTKILIFSILTTFDTNAKSLELKTDASKHSLGAELSIGGKVVAFRSGAVTLTEQNYFQIEKELYAILYGCRKFHQFVYGRRM
ncbi:hypothetical protein QYM36_006594, partial [Artemia franciscana]